MTDQTTRRMHEELAEVNAVYKDGAFALEPCHDPVKGELFTLRVDHPVEGHGYSVRARTAQEMLYELRGMQTMLWAQADATRWGFNNALKASGQRFWFRIVQTYGGGDESHHSEMHFEQAHSNFVGRVCDMWRATETLPKLLTERQAMIDPLKALSVDDLPHTVKAGARSITLTMNGVPAT